MEDQLRLRYRWILGEYLLKHEVAVCEKTPEPVLLELDIRILDYLFQLHGHKEN